MGLSSCEGRVKLGAVAPTCTMSAAAAAGRKLPRGGAESGLLRLRIALRMVRSSCVIVLMTYTSCVVISLAGRAADAILRRGDKIVTGLLDYGR